eukprot:g33601.t1
MGFGIVLTVNPDCSGSEWDLIMEKTDDMDLSAVESPCELKQPEPSPFSSKRTMYETEEVSSRNLSTSLVHRKHPCVGQTR